LKTYLVFEPQGAPRSAETAERVIFLREKFSWPALFFGPLWLLWHRLWMALAFWFAAAALVAVALSVLRPGSFVGVLAMMIPSLIVALEATELRRRKLHAKGFRDAGVVVAEDIESAERRFFDRWLTPEKAKPASAASLPPAPSTPQVIGFFPDPGGLR
jgi:Protein of unknown function (DUF2628)